MLTGLLEAQQEPVFKHQITAVGILPQLIKKRRVVPLRHIFGISQGQTSFRFGHAFGQLLPLYQMPGLITDAGVIATRVLIQAAKRVTTRSDCRC